MRLLTVYQKAYLSHTSYLCWLQGYYNNVAHSIALANAFGKKGTPAVKYPQWENPTEKLFKPKLNKESVELEYRKQQAEQQSWFFSKH